MFAPVSPTVSHLACPAGTGRPGAPNHSPLSSSLTEAYEMRLLAEVARWDDQAAFEEIYTRHQPAVMRVAMSICRDRFTAEEIVQQTFTALWVRAERLVEKSLRLRSWLTTVARNAAIDSLRADRHTAALEPAIEAIPRGAQPEEVAIAHETAAELARAIATLPEAQRAAVELVYFAGRTYQSAADELGEPVGTIKSRVRLAYGHLRDALQPAMG